MKIVRIHEFGGPEVLKVEELTILTPGPGEFVVKTAAASVNPVDYKIRGGHYPAVTAKDLPLALGRDGAGVVSRLGEGVEGVEVGDRVLVHLAFDRGGYAEEMVVRDGEWAKVPDGVDLDTAGALPLAGDTAWQGLFEHGGLKAGQRVLVHGASGGVGHLAVQFAKVEGAEVVATCGTKQVDFVRNLGVDKVVDYKKDRLEDAGGTFDLVFDLVGGDARRRSWPLLRPGGRLVTTVPDGEVEGQAQAAGEGRRGIEYHAEPRGADLARMIGLVADGEVRVHVDKSFPLTDVQEAHKHQVGHPVGKVLLKP